MPAGSVLERLRAATSDVHRALDAAVDPVRRLHARENRIALLRGYHRMHAGAEAAMAPFLSDAAGLEFAHRRRAPLLVAGLAELGVAPPETDPPAPSIDSAAAALGLLYVMEGSTLGGRMILRQLQANGADPGGLGFLDPYGAHTGAMWRAVLATLEQELGASAHAVQLAVHGARLGFAQARLCLCDTPALQETTA